MNTRRVISILTVLAVVAAMLPVCAFQSHAEGRKVRVGYYKNDVFQEGAAEGEVRSGYAYEYYLKISEYTGWEYEYVYGEFADLYEQFTKGEIDLFAGLAKKEDRLAFIAYPDMPMGSETLFAVKHDFDQSITLDPETMRGKSIGILDCALVDILNDYLKRENLEVDIVTFKDNDSLYRAFDHKEIDILAAEGDSTYTRPHSEVVTIFGSNDYYLCVNRDRPDLLKELNEAQSRLFVEEPMYTSSLRAKYYSSTILSQSFSGVERTWLKGHDELRIGYLNHYLPYCSMDENGNLTGILNDMMPEIIRRLALDNLTVTYTCFDSYDDMIDAVNAEAIDAAFPVGGGMYYSEESGIYQSNAISSTTTDLVFRNGKTGDVTDHFAVNENNRMQDYYIRTNYPDAKITYYSSIDDCLLAVVSGKVSATTLNGLRANEIIKNDKYDSLTILQLSKADDRCFGVRIGNEGLLRLLNRGVKVLGPEFVQNAAYLYAGDLYKYTYLDVIRDNIGPFLAVIMAVFLIILALFSRDLARTKRANRLKSDFVSNMSHEIRTPITAILGMNELIQRASVNNEVLSYSDNIERAGENLLGIINDILDFSKIEAGRMDLAKYEYSLADLLADLGAMVEYQAGKKGLKFEMIADPSLPCMLRGDEQKIRQVITNMLTNAVKYTEEGSVRLTVRSLLQKEKTVTLECLVSDTGIGIRPEEKDKLFTAFDRLDLKHTRNIQGTGLGLAITRHLLELMDSEIQVESTYGEGSVFSFVLKQEVSDPAPIGEISGQFDSKAGRKYSGATFIAPDVRLLIVDDTPMNLQVITGLLKMNRMQIDTAASGEECIYRFGRQEYDLVFLDQRMPNMDGVETLHELKGQYPERAGTTPIVCLTANVLAGAREQMLREGFTDYLTKPVNLAHMEDMLKKYLSEEKLLPVDGESAASAEQEAEGVIPRKVREIGFLDVETGLEYCGSGENFMMALRLYISSIDAKAALLPKELEDEDLKNYGINVHALKSSSRSVGAEALSEEARALEIAAKDGDLETVRRDTPAFLEHIGRAREELDAALNS